MLGAGAISDYHIAGLQRAGGHVVAITSRTRERARAKAEAHNVPDYAIDPYEVVQRPDVDAVVVATPDFTHRDLTLAAAAAGKAVMVQKPMATSSEDCRAMIDGSRTSGVLLCVSFMHRYFDEVTRARELLADGLLGSLTTVRQRNAVPPPGAAWFFDRDQAGGVVRQVGIHGIDLIRWLAGEISEVSAVARRVRDSRSLPDGTTVEASVDDLALANYRLASGALATHELDYAEAAGTDRFRTELYGTEGAIWLRSERGPLSVFAPRLTGTPGWLCPELDSAPLGTRHHAHFLAMVAGESAPDGSAEDGLRSLLVAEAIERSIAANGTFTPVRDA